MTVGGLARWLTGELNGSIAVAQGGELVVSAQAGHDMNSGNSGSPARIDNDGLVRWQGGTIRAWSGSRVTNRIAGGGRVRLTGGNQTWSGTTVLDGALELAGAAIFGEMALTGAAPMEWTSGRLYGAVLVAAGSQM